MAKRNKVSRISASFLLSYMLILLIPLSLFAGAYSVAIRTLAGNASRYHLSMLAQARDALELQITEAQRMSMQIARDGDVNDYLYALEKGEATPYQVWMVQKKLGDYLATNQYASQIYLCALEDHTILSTSYYHKDNTQNHAMTVNGSRNLVISPLYQYSLGALEPAALADDKISQETVMFIRTFPDGVVDTAYGNICIVFDQDRLEGLLSFTNEWNSGFNLILDANNRVMAASGADRELIASLLLSFDKEQDSYTFRLDGEEMYATYLKSPEYEWTYLSVYPRSQVLAETIHTQWIMKVYILVAAAIGVALALLLAFRNTRPIRRVVSSLDGVVPGGEDEGIFRDEYGVIETAIYRLVEENRDLSVHSQDQEAIVREAFFRLLMSRVAGLSLVKEMARRLGVALEESAFLGIRCSFERVSAHGVDVPVNVGKHFGDYVRRYVTLQDSAWQCAVYPDHEGMLALICFSSRQRLDLYAAVRSLIDGLERSVGELHESGGGRYRLMIGISNMYTDVSEVYNCDEEARFAAEYSRLFEFGRPVFYDAIGESGGVSRFTLSDHQHLLNILKAGNADAAQKVFNSIIQANVIDRQLNVAVAEQLFYAIKGVLLEGMDFIADAGVKESVQTVRFQENDVFTAFLSLEERYIAITGEIGAKKENRGSALVGEIRAYLDREYADAGISITSAAARFRVSEAYLSKLFRELTSETFAGYLERVRMEQASSLLADGRHTVVEIAALTGYNSVESFRRAFKRLTGISPSQYKEVRAGDRKQA